MVLHGTLWCLLFASSGWLQSLGQRQYQWFSCRVQRTAPVALALCISNSRALSRRPGAKGQKLVSAQVSEESLSALACRGMLASCQANRVLEAFETHSAFPKFMLPWLRTLQTTSPANTHLQLRSGCAAINSMHKALMCGGCRAHLHLQLATTTAGTQASL